MPVDLRFGGVIPGYFASGSVDSGGLVLEVRGRYYISTKILTKVGPSHLVDFSPEFPQLL